MLELEVDSSHNNTYIKKIILAIVLMSIIVIIMYFTNGKYIYKKEEAYIYNSNDLSYIVDNANKDSNGDGIENWKTHLLGSNPLQNTQDVNNDTQNNASTSKEKNLTNEVAINVYAAASEMRASGDTSTPTAVAIGSAIAAQTLDQNNNKQVNIDENKILISNDNSKAALKIYGNKLMAAIISFYPKVNEVRVLEKYYKNNDIKVLKDLQSNVDLLNFMLSEIYKIKVPSDAYNIHHEVLTRIAGAISVEQSLSRADKDALKAMIALQELRSFDKIVPSTLADIKAFFDKKNVYFISSEPGFIINK